MTKAEETKLIDALELATFIESPTDNCMYRVQSVDTETGKVYYFDEYSGEEYEDDAEFLADWSIYIMKSVDWRTL